MKKFILSILTLIMTVAMGLAFVSCGEDEKTVLKDPITGEAFPDSNAGKTSKGAVFAFVVRDEEGNKLADIEVQLCTLTGACQLPVVTDENGFCEYTVNSDEVYEIHYLVGAESKSFKEKQTKVGTYEYFLTMPSDAE